MRKFMILAIAVLGTALSTYAQSTTGPVKVNIVLNPTQEIIINDSEVVLEYKTQADYQNGVSVLKQGQLTAFSTGDYVIKVKALDESFSTRNGKKLEISDLAVEVINQGANPAAKVQMSNALQTITNTQKAGVSNFDIKYKAAGDNKYTDKVLDRNRTNYSADIQYEIIPV